MTDTFLEFLENKAKIIHDETWTHFSKGSEDSDWQNAKEKENLMGEIIREYKKNIG